MQVKRSLSNMLASVASPTRLLTRPTMTPTPTENHDDKEKENKTDDNVGAVVTEAKHDSDKKEESSSTPDWEEDIAKLLPRPPTKDGKPVITCLDFGVNREAREEKYPYAFFCSGCIFFVQEYGIMSAGRRKKMLPNGSRFKCTAKHPSFEEPAPNKIHSSLMGESENEDEDDTSRDF